MSKIEYPDECLFQQALGAPNRDWITHIPKVPEEPEEMAVAEVVAAPHTPAEQHTVASPPALVSLSERYPILVGALVIMPVLFIISVLMGDLEGSIGTGSDSYYDSKRMDWGVFSTVRARRN